MQVTPKIRELTFEGASTQDLRKVAVAEGMVGLYEDGIRKSLKGITTVEEVLSVASQKE